MATAAAAMGMSVAVRGRAVPRPASAAAPAARRSALFARPLPLSHRPSPKLPCTAPQITAGLIPYAPPGAAFAALSAAIAAASAAALLTPTAVATAAHHAKFITILSSTDHVRILAFQGLPLAASLVALSGRLPGVSARVRSQALIATAAAGAAGLYAGLGTPFFRAGAAHSAGVAGAALLLGLGAWGYAHAHGDVPAALVDDGVAAAKVDPSSPVEAGLSFLSLCTLALSAALAVAYQHLFFPLYYAPAVGWRPIYGTQALAMAALALAAIPALRAMQESGKTAASRLLGGGLAFSAVGISAVAGTLIADGFGGGGTAAVGLLGGATAALAVARLCQK